MPDVRVVLASLPLFVAAVTWSGVALPVALVLGPGLGAVALMLSGWVRPPVHRISERVSPSFRRSSDRGPQE